MATLYILPVPSTSPYGASTDKTSRKLIFKGSESVQTIEIPSVYQRRKNYANPIWSSGVPIVDKKYNVFSEELVNNPYYNNAKNLPTNWLTSGVEKSEFIDEQTFYEMKHNRVKGFYNTDIPQRRNRTQERTFLMDLRIVLNCEGVTILDTANPEHEIIYLIFKQSSKSYNSKFASSLEDVYRKNSNAEFYIADVEQEQEAKMQYEKHMLKFSNTMFKVIEEFSNEKLYKYCTILELVSGKTNRASCEEKILDFNKSAKVSEKDKKKAMDLFKMATETNLTDEFERQYLIQDCLNYRVLISIPEGYIWPSQKGTNRYEIAKSLSNLHKLLKDSKNKEILEMLKEELENKF